MAAGEYATHDRGVLRSRIDRPVADNFLGFASELLQDPRYVSPSLNDPSPRLFADFAMINSWPPVRSVKEMALTGTDDSPAQLLRTLEVSVSSVSRLLEHRSRYPFPGIE